MDNLIYNINQMIKDSDENVSILVKELNKTDYIYNYNSDIQITSASTIKVPIMLAVLEEVRQGNINLDDKILVKCEDILFDTEIFENGEKYYSLYELINWMIIKSDNTATNIIIKLLGMEKINNYILNVLNINSTSLQRYMLDKDAIKKRVK